ncbi:MAG: MtnX-like HAD-IB family phosphatase [Candidatus Gastranaerophilales bacterium]|nr:MtnX-like HAD-IB family phosphatase [Candidatus Gastranaerophilales bacterium]
MKDLIIVSDFDGTITKKDSLYNFFKSYANASWLEVEKLWEEGKISSKECLMREFELVEGLGEDLVNEYINNVELDLDFIEFNNYRIKQGIKLIIVSDGIDYFIKKILAKYKIENIEIISNHAEFINKKLKLSFPNSNPDCKNASATCKCAVVSNLKKYYNKIVYLGDGVSDYCVCAKADILYAKGSLIKYCKANNINHIEFQNFKDVLRNITF